MAQKITFKLKKLLQKVSNIVRNICWLLQISLGIKQFEDGTNDYTNILLVLWIFMLGIPIGTILFSIMSVPIWALIVALVSTLFNVNSLIRGEPFNRAPYIPGAKHRGSRVQNASEISG